MIPRLARAAVISASSSVLDSSLSKYRKVVSNCSSCAGVKFVILRDTICATCCKREKTEVERKPMADLIVNEGELLRDALHN